MTPRLHGVEIPREHLARFCREHGIRKLSLFGSILTDKFRSDSDVDLLVEFEKGRVPGFLGLARLEIDLTAMIGRKVDLRTPHELSRYFRSDVVNSAVVQYERS